MAKYIKGNNVANATSYELFEKANGVYTSLSEASEINFDVDALNLASGDHTLVVKAHASGYESSEYSNEVSVTIGEGGGTDTTYYTITYNYVDSNGTTIQTATTESVAAGTNKSFSISSAPNITGYEINSVSHSNITVTSNITIIYTYIVSTNTDLSINITLGSLSASSGNVTGSNDTWHSVEKIKVSNLTNTLTVSNSDFIIACYDASETYIGQLSSNNELKTSAGQWLNENTVVNISTLISLSVEYIIIVVKTNSPKILVNGVDCFGIEDTSNYPNYPFKFGSISSSDGKGSASLSRWCTDFLSLSDLGTTFTVKESKYLICCYDAEQVYIGQYSIKDDIIKNGTWNAADSVTTVSKLTATSIGASYVKIVVYSDLDSYLYVDGVALTE